MATTDTLKEEEDDNFAEPSPVAATLPDSDEFEVEIVEDAPPPPSAEADVAEPEPEPELAEAEAGAASANAEELEADEEYKAFSPKIQKRIQREIRIRKQAEAARNTAIEKAQEFERSVTAERTAKQQLLDNEAALRRQYAEVLVHAFGTQIELKQRDLKAARDAQEFDTEQKVQAEIDDLRFKHNQVKDMQRNIPAAPAAAAAASAPAPAPTPAPVVKENPLVSKWIARNAGWFNNPKFDAHREFARRLDARVAAEGYDMNSEEYYKELDRRIDSAFPTLRRKPSMNATTGKSPVAAVSSGNTPNNTDRGKIVLKQSDLDMMRALKLDPTDKEHLREYAKHKRFAEENT